MGMVDAAAKAQESILQSQLKSEKSAMEVRHKSAELLGVNSDENVVVKYSKLAGRSTEYVLQIAKESMLNMPGCVSGRKGIIAVRAKTAEGVGIVKATAKKATKK